MNRAYREADYAVVLPNLAASPLAAIFSTCSSLKPSPRGGAASRSAYSSAKFERNTSVSSVYHHEVTGSTVAI